MSADAETRGLAEPFKGITTAGRRSRGCSASARPACPPSRSPGRRAWLASLTPEQRTKTTFGVDDPEWRKWMNQHFYLRQGVGFDEMTEAQREAAFGLLRASLSARGLKLTRDIMRLNHTLGELNNNDFEQYGEWLYWITVMGTPSATEPWGWQLDGHHAIVNYFVLGDQVVMTPTFVGSEPVIAEAGKYKGTAILQEEQRQGLALDPRADRCPARQGHRLGVEGGQQQRRRGVQGQRRPRLRRRARDGAVGRTARGAAVAGGRVRRQHGRRARANQDGGSPGAPRRHLVRLDRRHR